MATEIKMPDLGTTVERVTLLSWLKSPGDTVKRGEPLCEVETDKATSQLESVTQGVLLKQLVPPGTEIEVGTVIAYIGDPAESIPEGQTPTPAGPTPAPAAEPPSAASAAASPADVKVSPMIRNLAKRLGVDLNGIAGSGPGGQILRRDVLDAQKPGPASPDQAPAAVAPAPAARAPATAGPPAAPPRLTPMRVPDSLGSTIVSSNQLAVARTITHSHRHIIPINVFARIKMAAAIALRDQNAAGQRPSYDALFVYAVGQAIKEAPRFKCYFENDSLITTDGVHVGVAISPAEDLFIPVVRHADRKSITQIDQEIRLFAEKATRHALTPLEMTGATFTVSNLGMFDIEAFTAVIPPRQAGILSIGAVRDVVAFKPDNMLAAEKVARIILAVDHRFINGRTAAAFLTRVKQIMEDL